jgi:hypothetical protein
MKHVPPPSGEPLGALDNLAMAVPPRWGEAVLRLAKATERVVAKLDELPIAPAGVDYVPRVRELTKSLIDFLDGLEDTDQDTACDDAACDDNELDGPENGEDEESEPDEPSLGSRTSSEWSNQESWGTQPFEMRTLAGTDLEDEHDGAEPENEGGEAVHEDDEPSLGWTIDGVAGDQSGDERELQDHATVAPKANRRKLPNTIDVEQRGYGGRTVIRKLTDGQTEAVAERMDRYGKVSLE